MKLQKLTSRPNPLSNRAFRNIPILIFLAVWMLPVLHFGLLDRTPLWLPKFFSARTNISRLFPSEHTSIAVYEVQFQRLNSTAFEVLDDNTLSRMRPFGFRTRLQRAFSMANEPNRKAMALWLKDKLDGTAPRNPVTRIKYLFFPYSIQEGQSRYGPYSQPLSSRTNQDTITVLSQYDFANHSRTD